MGKQYIRMFKDIIKPISVTSALRFGVGSHIGDEILLLDNITDIPMPTEPRRMESLLVALCTEGEAEFTIDTMPRTVRRNDIIIVSAGQVVDGLRISPDCEGKSIIVDYAFFNEVIKNVHDLSSLFLFARNHPVYALDEATVQTIGRYYDLLREKVVDETHLYRRQVVQSLFSTMIIDLSNTMSRIQDLGDAKRTRGEQIFTDFIRLVEQNFRGERRVEWYAHTMCISSKYLSEIVKGISLRTPSDWIESYVTLELRVLLRNTTFSIKEIAQRLAFPNQSFLGKYFKERVGMSPSEYRKSK